MNNRVLSNVKVLGRNVAVDAEVGGSGLKQVHIQIKGSGKIPLNSRDDIAGLPKALRKNATIQKAIEKAFQWLEKVE
jgi:hypothetical protein